MKKSLKKIFYLRAWRFIFSERIILLLTPTLYIMLALEQFSLDFIPQFILLIITISAYFFYGVTLNDYFDKEYDLDAGKSTGVRKFSNLEVSILLSISLALLLIVGWIIAKLAILIYLFGVIFVTIYSHSKTRLKEMGMLGVIIVTTSELSPFLFIMAFFGYFSLDAILFASAYWLFCFIELINHQATEDYKTDKKSGLKTFGVRVGYDKAIKISRKLSALWLLTFFAPLSAILLFKIDYFFIPLTVIICFNLLHIKINPEIKTAFEIPLYFYDIGHLGMFRIFPVYFALLLFLKYPPYLFIFLLAIFSNYELDIITINRIRSILK